MPDRKTQCAMGRRLNRDTRISLVRSPDMSLDMSRLLDIIGRQVRSEDSSDVPFRTAFFDLAFVTQIGFASLPLKIPAGT